MLLSSFSTFLRGVPTYPVWPDWADYYTLGNFSKPVETINLSNLPTYLGNFCKGVTWNHFGAAFIDIWKENSGNTAPIPISPVPLSLSLPFPRFAFCVCAGLLLPFLCKISKMDWVQSQKQFQTEKEERERGEKIEPKNFGTFFNINKSFSSFLASSLDHFHANLPSSEVWPIRTAIISDLSHFIALMPLLCWISPTMLFGLRSFSWICLFLNGPFQASSFFIFVFSIQI